MHPFVRLLIHYFVLAGWASGLVVWALDLASWASGLAGWALGWMALRREGK